MNPKENNSFSDIDAALAQATGKVRKRGLMRFVYGLLGTVPTLLIVYWLLPKTGLQPSPIGLMLAGIPAAYALLGLIECVTGIPYNRLAARWDGLRGWQRGVYGCSIVLVAFIVIIFLFSTALPLILRYM